MHTIHCSMIGICLRAEKQSVIAIKWFPTNSNYTVFFTKNVDENSFDKWAKIYCGPKDG